jgi:beta-glucanase (GH16 family)
LERVLFLEEEFNGAALDVGRFDFELGAGLRNEEVQAYTSRAENVRVEAGALVLTARAEAYETSSYTSGSIRLKSGFTFGRVEVRAQVPLGRGLNASVWMMPSAPGRSIPTCVEGSPCYSGTWPAWGDILVATLKSRSPGRVFHGVNYGIWDAAANAVRHGVSLDQDSLVPDPGAYHVYVLDWGPTRMDWFADGELLSSLPLPPPDMYLPEGKNPFHQAFSLKLNLAVGGLDQAPVGADYPADFRVDSVRIWQWRPEG